MNVLKVLFELVAYLSMAPLCVLCILNEVPGSVFVFLFSLLSLGLPDLIKPQGWVAPNHNGNHGLIDVALTGTGYIPSDE